MVDWFNDGSAGSSPISITAMTIRLIAACLFGFLVAVSYRLHRRPIQVPSTFPLTLVLLSILIAMVMQVIDDRVARAFSLVGALSIVRFRTVLDDTQDIAFVIFAVVVGMASGTGAMGVAAIGSVVMIGTLFASKASVFQQVRVGKSHEIIEATLKLRMSIGVDYQGVITPLLDSILSSYRLVSAETARGGSVLEWAYAVRFNQDIPIDQVIDRCCKTVGIQSVDIQVAPQNT